VAEWFLFIFLARHAEISDLTARAIFSGARVQDSISFIKRLCGIKKLSPKKDRELGDVLGQLARINDFRNHILHYHASAEFIGGQLIISNDMRAITGSRLKSMAASPDILRHVILDLLKILLHLHKLIGYPRNSAGPATVRASVLKSAWLYKPQPLSSPPTRGSKSRTRTRKRRSLRPESPPS
jgi:hypothetical protein